MAQAFSPRQIESAILLQLLRDDHHRQWSRAELEGELFDIDSVGVKDALACLHAMGVVHVNGEHIQASRIAWHISALKMVAV